MRNSMLRNPRLASVLFTLTSLITRSGMAARPASARFCARPANFRFHQSGSRAKANG
jgi:hypothetical protein